MMIGLSNGEAIRNDIVLPKGTPALRNPTVIGMVEQAQNGVSAPNPAAASRKPFLDFFLRDVHQDDFHRRTDQHEQRDQLKRDEYKVFQCYN